MPNRNAVLILADAFDAHADVVTSKLKALGTDCYRFDLDVNSLKSSVISFDGYRWAIAQSGYDLTSDEVGAVWCRKATVSLTSEHEEGRSNGFRIWRSEWNRVLCGLYSELRGRPWLNPLQQSSLADNKYYQLSIAKSVGLSVPEYITSNSPGDLRSFADQGARTALKLMSQDLYRADDGTALGLYVNTIGPDDIADFASEGENPITLQRYIEKQYEVRYTFIGDKHFVCKIDSQASPRTAIDWRRYDIPKTPHFRISPPSDIRLAVETLMQKLGIAYGAADFIVDKNSKWWF